ncbi:MAG: HAD hydrolase family protein, partial [Erysipelotrichaceae bacterium]|nr:HAD hydrolase family protein [Erysipelotrichaceae bacterium]
TLKDTLGNSRFVRDYLMFQVDAKHQGIVDMMNHLNAPLEDVVVFGDDYNDMIMFDSRWTSIAMGNACDALKEKADFVTKANIDDGVDYACQVHHWYDPVDE